MAAAPQLFAIPDEVAKAVGFRMPKRSRKDEDWFFDFCQINSDWLFEQTAEGVILVMAPPALGSVFDEGEVYSQLRAWALKDRTGAAISANAGFRLPNGATRLPDAAWIRKSRLKEFSREQMRHFLPICPDFVVEVRSPSDRLPTLQKKMEEYRSNGARLGWLIDPETQRVYVYRPNRAVEVLQRPKQVSGDPELPGFKLKLAEIWNPSLWQ